MSIEVTAAMVDMFSANVMHLSQERGSVLWEHCRQEEQNAESEFYDRIGARTVRRKEGRHSDVVYDDTPHSRRMVTTEDFYSADLVDKEDKLRTIMNLENEYAIAIGMAIGRQKDEEIISFALGNAYSGKKGTTAVPLPNSQKLAAFDGATATGVGLNVGTLRKVRKTFKQNKAIVQGEKIVFAYAAEQADNLLASTEVTSSDFNTVKALVDGEVNSFMGMIFVETELLTFNAAIVNYEFTTGAVSDAAPSTNPGTIAIGRGRSCIAFTQKRGLLCAIPSEVMGRIDELPQKHYSHQVYGSLSIGGTRMEEVQVMEVICFE